MNTQIKPIEIKRKKTIIEKIICLIYRDNNLFRKFDLYNNDDDLLRRGMEDAYIWKYLIDIMKPNINLRKYVANFNKNTQILFIYGYLDKKTRADK